MQALQVADSVQRALDAHYLEILEKTNAQLSMGWWTPFGVSITILTLFVTLGTVALAVILYRQGKDYQDRGEKILKDFAASFSSKLAEADEQLKAFVAASGKARAQILENEEETVANLNQVIVETEGADKGKLEAIRDELLKQRALTQAEFDRLVSMVLTRKFDQSKLALALPRSVSETTGAITTWEWICPLCSHSNLSGGSGLKAGEIGVLQKLCGSCGETSTVAFTAWGKPRPNIRPCTHCGKPFDRVGALIGNDWPDGKLRHKCPHCGNYSE